MLEHEDLTALGELVGVREALEAIRRTLERANEWGAIDAIQRVSWPAGGQPPGEFNARGSMRGVMVVNENAFTIQVGFVSGAGGRGAGAPEVINLPANGWILLPIRTSVVSVGAANAGNATIIALSVAFPPAMGPSI